MGVNQNLDSYEDIRPHFDRALDSKNGVRITVATRGAAVHLRQRLYTMRALERKQSLEMYGVGDVRRGLSPYDNLTITITDNAVEIRPALPLKVEDL